MNIPEIKLDHPLCKYAFFFDLDGVLSEIADTPQQAFISPDILELLGKLKTLINDAVAIISGRSLNEIERLISPLELHRSGLHGLQTSVVQTSQTDWSHKLDSIREDLFKLPRQFEGVLLEDKQHCIAIHYRQAPEVKEVLLANMKSLITFLGNEFNLLQGKMVFEIKPANINKASAVESFLKLPEFKNKVPVYLGDDITDEDAFVFVNAKKGISIRVGERKNTVAKNYLRSVGDVQIWLENLIHKNMCETKL